MGKRTVSIGSTIEQVDWESLWAKLQPRGNDYVSELRDGTPMAGLIWEEAHRIMRDARLTGYQSAIFRVWLQGWDPTTIGVMFPNPETGEARDPTTIRECILASLKKISKLKHLGLLTVMIESQGWQPVRDYMSLTRADGMLSFESLPDNEKIGYCAMVTGDYRLLTMKKKQRISFLKAIQGEKTPFETSI